MTKKYYYAIHEMGEGHPGCYSIGKMTSDLEVLETYYLSPSTSGQNPYMCTCPSYRQPCKHTTFLRKFVQHDKLETNELWDPIDQKFVSPGDI